jgi:hypothetical protein
VLYERNERKYGDPLGPTFEHLVKSVRSCPLAKLIMPTIFFVIENSSLGCLALSMRNTPQFDSHRLLQWESAGLRGEDAFEQIIASSTRSNQEINAIAAGTFSLSSLWNFLSGGF